MAIFRNTPYENRRFSVEIDGIQQTGFSEVILPEMTVDVLDYREGNDPSHASRRIPGAPHFGKLILKRGFKGSLEFYQWWLDVSNGNVNSRRNMVVKLLSEDHTQVAATWKFHNAFPSKYEVSEFDARGCDIVIETIEIVCDTVEIE
jgi:phage tail-like protein